MIGVFPIQILIFRMLCNNADELGLPVLKLDFARMKSFACRRYPSTAVIRSIFGGKMWRPKVSPEIFGEILPVRYRRICNGFLAL